MLIFHTEMDYPGFTELRAAWTERAVRAALLAATEHIPHLHAEISGLPDPDSPD